MRTNIVIDDELMETALHLTGLDTKKSVVHHALTELVASIRRRRMLGLKGELCWEGDLDRIRRGRLDPR